MARELLPWVRQLKRQKMRAPRPLDSWVVFAEAPSGGGASTEGAQPLIYCYDFSSGTRCEELLPEAVRTTLLPSVLPATVVTAPVVTSTRRILWL